MNLALAWLQSYSVPRLVALAILPILTAHTLVESARQIQRAKGVRRCLWVVGGSLPVALGLSCTMELSTGDVAGAFPITLPDHLLQAGCAFLGCVWIIATLARRHLHMGWVLFSSLALALGFSTMGDVATAFGLRQNITADKVSLVSFLVAAATSCVFLKLGALAQTEPSWSLRAMTSTSIMGLLLSTSLALNFQVARAGSLQGAQDNLAGGLPLTALCCATVAVLVSALAAISISKQNFMRSIDAQKTSDEQRVRENLADQRVIRLQNEALVQEVQERQRAEEKLRYAAFHDAATGWRIARR